MTNQNKKETIDEKFKEAFKTFEYPMKTSNDLIQGLTESEQQEYFKEARRIRDSRVIIQELNEVCRSFYLLLATDLEEPMDRALHKGALLFATKFRTRLNILASQYRDPDKLAEEAEEINELLEE